VVPCPLELVTLMRDHIDKYRIDEDGLVFIGEKGGSIPLITYTRVWRSARATAFTKEICRTPLAQRPHDLRHAAVSTWLNAGVPVTTVAKWAGHSVGALLSVYAACLHGQDEQARKQVEHALGG
jgi:integrase